MEFVEIYKTQNNGSQKILATCRLIDNKVVCKGDEIFVKNLEKGGILDYTSSPRQKLFPKHGLKFLQQLQNNFRSGYLIASDIKKS